MKYDTFRTMVEPVDRRPPHSPIVETELNGIPPEFLDVQPYSHLNYKRFPDVFELGQNDLIAKSGLESFEAIDAKYGVKSFVKKKGEMVFDTQVRATDKVTLYTSIKRIGETSITFGRKMFANGATAVSDFELVVVFVDSKDQKTNVPDEIKEKLRPYVLGNY